MARPVAVDPHDRRRSPSQRRTSLSHQLRRTPGEKQRPRRYKPPGQTVNTADSARTMSGALGSCPGWVNMKTIVAVEHSILTAVWHMLTDNVDYHDIGGDYFTKQDPERAMRRIIRQANALGLTVRFDPIPDVA